MRIEHVGIQVRDPAAMADWYAAHLGFSCKRSSDRPNPVRFLADVSGTVMVEAYNNPAIDVPDYAAMHPLLFHLAFVCDNVPATIERLIGAGATVVSGPERMANGDHLAMLRDPWGMAIQLCQRGEAMV